MKAMRGAVQERGAWETIQRNESDVKVKAIVLWEPWAILMALGLKHNETRHWPTSHRGELAICAAKREPDWRFIESHGPVSIDGTSVLLESRNWFHPGCVLGVANLFDVWNTSNTWNKSEPSPRETNERHFGNYQPGRFAWLTKDMRRLGSPVPVTGRQGLFNLPPEVEAAVRRQMP